MKTVFLCLLPVVLVAVGSIAGFLWANGEKHEKKDEQETKLPRSDSMNTTTKATTFTTDSPRITVTSEWTTSALNTTSQPSLSTVSGWINRFKRQRGNSTTFHGFQGDLYLNGNSVKHYLGEIYNVKFGYVYGNHYEQDNQVNVWFSSSRTTLDLIGLVEVEGWLMKLQSVFKLKIS